MKPFSLSKTPILGSLVMQGHAKSDFPLSLLSAVFSACLGPFSFGYTLGYTSPAIPDLERQGILNTDQASWFGPSLILGAVFGGPLAGYITEKAGKRNGLILTCMPSLLGWLVLSSSSGHFFMMLIGRILCGISCGMAVVCCPVYIAEVSTKDQRGFLGVMTQLFITMGILFVYTCGSLLGWYGLCIVGLIIPVVNILVLLVLTVPETPRWFLMNNRKAEGMRSLEALRGFQVDVEDECNDIQESIDPHEEFHWKEFQKKELSAPLRLSIFLMGIQQFSGINVIMFYANSIFESAGFTNASAASIVIALVQVIFTVIASIIMDKAGRRILLTIASFGMALSCYSMAYYYAHKGSFEWLALFSVIFYIMFFSLGWGPIPILVMSEIFPVRSRSSASAIAITSNWIFAFIVTKEFGTLTSLLGESGAFIVFGCVCLAGLGYVFKYVPETKGKSLEDIELFFLGRAIRSV